MKKAFALLSLVFLLVATLFTPQVSQASSAYSATVTISGQEYTLKDFNFDIDQFVAENGIQESDKLEKISIHTPTGVESVDFNFGFLTYFFWDQSLTVVNNRADYVIANRLGNLDQGQDGIAISNLRQLLYPFGKKVKATAYVNYANGSTDVLTLSISTNKQLEVPITKPVNVSGISVNTSKGTLTATGANNVFNLNLGWDASAEIQEVKLTSPNAVSVSIFAKDSHLYREETELKFVNNEAVLTTDKLEFDPAVLELTGGQYPSSFATVEEIKALVKQSGVNTLYGVVIDAEGNQSTFSVKLNVRGWSHVDNKWSFLDEFGVEQKGWLLDGGKYYFFNPSGQMATGWVLDGGKYYFLDRASGAMKTGWILDGGKYYFLDRSGAMKTGWVLDGGKYYFMDRSGAMKTGWVLDGGKYYFLDRSGAMATGWALDGGQWYFMERSGAMKTGWVLDGGQYYYLSASGAMKTGWLAEGKYWYFLENSGVMKTGWKQLGKNWFYFYNSGAMAANTTVNGYKFDRNGVWYR